MKHRGDTILLKAGMESGSIPVHGESLNNAAFLKLRDNYMAEEKKKNNKTIIIGYIVIAVLFFAIIFYAAPWGAGIYKSWRIGKSYGKFENDLNAYLAGDNYGGRTPKETYELFVEALKKGDVDLASKYYLWDKQAKQRDRFRKMKIEGRLDAFAKELPPWEELEEGEHWDPDVKRFIWTKEYEEETVYSEVLQREISFPSGEGDTEIDFTLNNQSQIWKIVLL